MSISFKSNVFSKNAMFKLDKLDNQFDEDELKEITDLVIDYDLDRRKDFVFLDEILYFTGLKSLSIRNAHITKEECEVFSKLKKLNSLTLDYCVIDEPEFLSPLSLESLSLVNCDIGDCSFITSFSGLKELIIISDNVKIEDINKLQNLTFLELSYSNIEGSEEIKLPKLESIYLDNTNIENFSFLESLPELANVSIDKKQYQNNTRIFESLISKKILVYDEGIVPIGGEADEL